MGGFGNFMSGAAGGAGAGIASLASRYVDDEIQRNRAQALADIQHNSMVRAEEYQQSAPVQERRLGNERNLLQMRNQENLAGRVAEASSPELRQARIDDRVQYLQGTTPAEIESQNAITEGTAPVKLKIEADRYRTLTPLEIERAGGIARVNADQSIRVHTATEEAREKRERALKTAFDKLPDAKKLQFQEAASELKDVNKAIVEAQASGGWDTTKNQGHRQLELTKSALQQRMNSILGGAEAADPFGLFGERGTGVRSTTEAILKDAAQTGTKDFIVELNGTRMAYGNATLPGVAVNAPGSPSSSLMEQKRDERASAPDGSPQAKWNARQQQLRDEAASRENDRRARVERARAEFDADAKSMDALELVRKYSDPASRSGLDTARLTRLNQIERSIR